MADSLIESLLRQGGANGEAHSMSVDALMPGDQAKSGSTCGTLPGVRLASDPSPIRCEDVMRGFLDSRRLAIVCCDEWQRIVVFNPGAEVMFGWSAAEAIGQTFKILVPARYHDEFDKQSHVSFAFCGDNVPWPIRCLRRRNGEEFQAEVSISESGAAGGCLTSMILRDVSNQLEKEQEIRRLASIVSHSTDAIFTIDAAGDIVTWNTGATTLLGYNPAQAIGRHYSLLALFCAGEPFVMEAIAHGPAPLDTEITAIRRDGTTVPISIRVADAGLGEEHHISAIMRDISGQRRREEHMKIVMRELSHRAKNLLAVISAISRNTAVNSATVEDFDVRFSSRIRSLAHSHDLLVKFDWAGADLKQLCLTQLSPFVDPSGWRCKISGPDVVLRPQAAQMIGLALHELATNASKYGALSIAGSGIVELRWSIADDRLNLRWRESAGPLVAVPKSSGFGRMVTEVLVPEMLDGTVDLDFEPSGVRWRLSIPLTHLTEVPPMVAVFDASDSAEVVVA